MPGLVATAAWRVICIQRDMHTLRGLACAALFVIASGCGGQSENSPDGDDSTVGGESSGGADPTSTDQAGATSTGAGGIGKDYAGTSDRRRIGWIVEHHA